MNKKIILNLAMSLDGYIARLDHRVDYLDGMDPAKADAFHAFLKNVDTIIMGSTSYDKMMDLGGHPFPEKHTYVLTTQEYEDVDNVEFVDLEIEDMVKLAKKKTKNNIWLFGGAKVVQQFIDKGFIDEFIITIAPRVIGTGIPLFLFSDSDVELELVSSEKVGDFVTLHYRKK
jgi:dihydrofolate reductase